MAIFLKLHKSKIGPEGTRGHWFALPVRQGEIGISELAEHIQKNTTFSKGEVQGLLICLTEEIKNALQRGQTVNLEGFGRFHLKVETTPSESPETFRVDTNVRAVKCRFVPASRKNINGGRTQLLAEGVEIKMWKW